MKKNRRAGFTLAETLITVLLMAIVFMAITGGFVALQRSYKKITQKANAEILLSTAVMEITSDLQNATVYYSDSKAFETDTRKYTIQYGTTLQISDERPSLGIWVIPYPETAGSTLKAMPLVTDKTNTGDLYTDCTAPVYDDTTKLFTITVKVYAADNPSQPMESQDISIRNENVTVKTGS